MVSLRSFSPVVFTALAATATVAAGCGDEIGFPPGDANPTGGSGGNGGNIPQDFSPAPGGIRRLLREQYIESVRVLFGDVGADVADPPADQSLKGFDVIGNAEIGLGSTAVDKYDLSSRNIAAAVIGDDATRNQILACEPASINDAECYGTIAADLGRVAWRRDLTEVEIDRVVTATVTAATAYGTVDGGLESLISALIQSVNFIYIVELGVPDETNPSFRRLTPHELVTRMSFFLTNTTPDVAMLNLADEGELDDAALRSLAADLLARPAAAKALRRFFDELYRLRDLPTTPKSTELFPEFTPAVSAAMRESMLQFFDDIVWVQNADARRLFDSTEGFVNADIAPIYGVQPPANGFAKITLPGEQARHGFMTQAPMMALLAHSDSTSATRRGAFVQDRLLCAPIDPPPPTANPNLPPVNGTAKQKLEQHMEDESCAGCHALMDPIGFAYEPYDAIGRWRQTDNGLAIDPSGDVPNIGSFANATELQALIAADENAAKCLIRNVFRHSMGHFETNGELPVLDELAVAFEDDQFRVQSLLVELCASAAFRLVGEPK